MSSRRSVYSPAFCMTIFSRLAFDPMKDRYRKERENPKAPIADNKRVFARTFEIRIKVCAGTLADLKVIGQAWQCAIPNVVWALIVTWINDSLRGRSATELPFGHSARYVLAKAHKLELELMEEEMGCPPHKRRRP